MSPGTPMHIVAFAYACEPGKGGEPAAGWVWAKMLCQVAQLTIVTRSNNKRAIEEGLTREPELQGVRFVYVDLPPWARRWKRGPRGAHLYYLLWQVAAVRTIRRDKDQIRPDAVWHLTWANVWLGALAPILPYPFLYGPVGGGVGTPWRLARALGWRGFLSDLSRAASRGLSRYLNPLARLAWYRAETILVQNPETREWLPVRHRHKAVVFPNVVLEEIDAADGREEPRIRRGPPFTMLFAGRLLPLKGVSLAIRTLVSLPEWELLICGDGPDRARLLRLARRLGVHPRVRFLGWVPRDEARRVMRDCADVLIFPSLHEEGGFVVAEARNSGLPVVCLDRGGPPVLGGRGVKALNLSTTVAALADAIEEVLGTTPEPYPPMPAHVHRLRCLLDGLPLTEGPGSAARIATAAVEGPRTSQPK